MNGITWKQERYIRHLLEAKAWKFDAPNWVAATQAHVDSDLRNLTGGRDGTGSKLIAYLKRLPDTAEILKTHAVQNHAVSVATADSFEQITGVRPESVTDNRQESFDITGNDDFNHWVNRVDPKAPSKAVRTPSVADGWVKGRPTVGARPNAPTARPGLYVRDGEVFKVTESKRNPGQFVAKLIGTMERGHRKATFIRGMVWKLTDDQRMTPEQAKAYGDKFGQCVNCGKALNDPASVKLGMGPVCHKRLTGHYQRDRNRHTSRNRCGGARHDRGNADRTG